MGDIKRGRSLRCAIAWVLATAVLSGTALASPIIRERPRDVAHDSGTLFQDADLPLTAVGDVLREVRRTGTGVTPSLLGIDDGFLSNGALVHSELRDQIPLSQSRRASPAKSLDGGGPDLFRETLDNALKATREAFFDGGDWANFSVAGVEVNAMLRGERRGISINGYELLISNQEVNQAYAWQLSGSAGSPATVINAAAEDGAVAQRSSADLDARGLLREVKKLLFHPMTAIVALALFVVWLVAVAVGERSRSENN